MIDDVPIEQTGLVQIRQGLLYRVGAESTVRVHGGGIMTLDEHQVVVQIRKLLPRYLVSQQIGEYLFGPNVVKPLHRHHIAEPHVGCFVSDEVQSGQFLVGCGTGPQEDGVGIELNGTRMLHAAKLIAGQDDTAVLFEWEGDACVVLHPSQRQCNLVKHRLQLGCLLRISLAVKQFQRATVPFSHHTLKTSRRERDEISGHGTLGATRHRLVSLFCRCFVRHERRLADDFPVAR